MLDDLSTLRFTVLSGLIGFGVFCISYAFLVWNRRNKSIEQARGIAWVGFLRRVAALSLFAGLAAMAVGWAVRETVRPQGRLNGEELFAVRARKGFQLDRLTDREFVNQGDTLAGFRSPIVEAEIDELKWHRQRLTAERQARSLEPLELDPEIVRRHEAAISDRRQLRDLLQHLVPAREEIVRESLQNRLKRLEEIAELQVTVDWYKGEVEQSTARWKFNQQQLDREQLLAQQDAGIEREMDGWRRETRVYEVDVAKMKDKVRDSEAHQQQLKRGIDELTALATSQTGLLDNTIADVRFQLSAASDSEQSFLAQLDQDLRRAEANRRHALGQLDMEIREVEAKLSGAESSLVVTAPFSGRVIYRSRAPGAVYNEGPMLIVGPTDGYRMRLRLPAQQLAAFQQADPLLIQLDYTYQERLVEGRFRGHQPLEWEPSYVLAELDCLLPHETAWMLAEGEEVGASLVWRPPLHTLWPFQLGAVLAALGITGLLLSLVMTRRVPVKDATGEEIEAASEPATALPLPTHTLNAEFGSDGAMLRMLGSRLRASIDTGQVEPDLLSAVEWSIDRHQQRAIKMLAEGLGRDTELLEQIAVVLGQLDDDDELNGRRSIERLERILQTIGPHELASIES